MSGFPPFCLFFNLGCKHPAVTGIGAPLLQVLPPLLDIIPEARLNLVIYHLRKDEATEVPLGLRSAESAHET